MKEIVVISGKGGTGKTSVAASLVVLAERSVVADCDVDAADLHLVLDPRVIKTEDFTGGKSARIVPGKCSSCGKCLEICWFNAVIKDERKKPAYIIDHIACEGCGVCSYFCPEKAIDFEPSVNGQWFVSDTRYGPMVHARLGIAEENSGKLVSLVRNQARMLAEKDNLPYIIVDGPPGIGCPVISSITGADAVLIVTEPTVSGAHDLERVAELARHFKIPTFLCINKYDLNYETAKNIEEKARVSGITVIGRIHYDRAVTEAQIKGFPVVAFPESAAAKDMRTTWESLVRELN
ncbi:MAG: Septum site-determining protein MinD [Pelotomaculum sp. PtaB.Bin013]|uniref:ATP-binding protein n=1 Tax=Pelotomaculum isophthalicicum JI TaxID=947010 RepID=A0A9X4JWP1_9FIRM|nr:ATP-binding protein [Pelotomaculum isophthalicicum]MDF9409822.1 ATP-binding protein [Pelotomaculum isophthalicicum JI]OPX85811.1 MAG: Septum site-determining protein MinD [Pelotomaculum sp. PtaB.Bin013]